MDMERGWQIHRWDSDTSVQNKYPQQNSNERVKQEMCQMRRGAVKDGVIEFVHCCTTRKPTSLPGRSWAYQALYFISSCVPLFCHHAYLIQSGFWRYDKPLAIIIHLVDMHLSCPTEQIGLLFPVMQNGIRLFDFPVEYWSCSVIDRFLSNWLWHQAFSNIMNVCI